MAIPDLPEEVLCQIFGYLCVQSRKHFHFGENRMRLNTLLAATYAAKHLARAASPTLYRVIDLRFLNDDQCVILLRQLMKNPRLASTVREMHIVRSFNRPNPRFHDDPNYENPISNHLKRAIHEMGFSPSSKTRVTELLKHDQGIPLAALLLRPCVKLEVLLVATSDLLTATSLLSSTVGMPRFMSGVDADRFSVAKDRSGIRLQLPHLRELIVISTESLRTVDLETLVRTIERPNMTTLQGSITLYRERPQPLAPMPALKKLFLQGANADGLVAILIACPALETLSCYWPDVNTPKEFHKLVKAVETYGTQLRKLVLVQTSHNRARDNWDQTVGKPMAQNSLKKLTIPIEALLAEVDFHAGRGEPSQPCLVQVFDPDQSGTEYERAVRARWLPAPPSLKEVPLVDSLPVSLEILKLLDNYMTPEDTAKLDEQLEQLMSCERFQYLRRIDVKRYWNYTRDAAKYGWASSRIQGSWTRLERTWNR